MQAWVGVVKLIHFTLGKIGVSDGIMVVAPAANCWEATPHYFCHSSELSFLR